MTINTHRVLYDLNISHLFLKTAFILQFAWKMLADHDILKSIFIGKYKCLSELLGLL